MTRTSQNLGYFSTGKILPPLNVRPQQLRTPRMLQEKRGKKTHKGMPCAIVLETHLVSALLRVCLCLTRSEPICLPASSALGCLIGVSNVKCSKANS